MRLIDADKFAIEEPKLWDWSSVDGISSTAVLKQCIWDVQCAPVVEAIPIEWIKGYLTPFQVHYDSLSEESQQNSGAGWVIDVIESMLRDWEKENGEKTD